MHKTCYTGSKLAINNIKPVKTTIGFLVIKGLDNNWNNDFFITVSTQ